MTSVPPCNCRYGVLALSAFGAQAGNVACLSGDGSTIGYWGGTQQFICEHSLKFPEQFSKEFNRPMISKLAQFFLAAAFLVSMGAMAQTAATPDAPSAAPSIPVSTGTRIGAINVEQAIYATNEGRAQSMTHRRAPRF